MLKSWLRDLQWRKRRFLVATIGAGLLFGVTLSTTGISSGFDVEVSRTVAQLRVDHWIVGRGAVGPFLGSAPMAASRVAAIAALPGVRRAVPTVYTRKDVLSSGKPKDVNVFGAPAGALALPRVSEGRAPRRAGEIAIGTKLEGYDIGDALVLAGHRLRVVGRVSDSTSLGGVPNVFLTLRDAQRVAFDGQPVASAIAIDGTVRGAVPADLKVIDNAAAREDLLRALEQARKSIYLTAILSWVVAAMIIGSVIYLSVTERLRDFAVFKAIGISTRSIVVGLSFEALIVSAGAAIVGGVVAALLGPNLSLPVSISWRAYMLLPAIALVVGLGASLIGVRKAVSVDPAAAFGGP